VRAHRHAAGTLTNGAAEGRRMRVRRRLRSA
jgi:hypothetical protein